MAPVMIVPATMPPMTAPGPQRRPYCALASVAVAASVPVMIAAAVSAVSVFFMPISLRMVGSADQEFNRPEGNTARRAIWLSPPSITSLGAEVFVGIWVIHKGKRALNRPRMELTKPEQCPIYVCCHAFRG